ncbi:DUF3885 domain-containing protein [Bacillus mojavensis]|uniref:DUF3885 domain-containing protein n=1 Tax=Bacillus mojavensis TaxID=72360 RepID=UPI002DBBDDE4|nr:DUF3885 domain-containing protein [Bacillus mojavensis]MEC1679920.1 DUF3885 domain-containing protein [Bacillus mojavensis]MEC1713686.1 DUF3885 domain-containing protein [Bacillus mojavensis]
MYVLPVNEYVLENFPGLRLTPPLFYNWQIGIRFEIGVGYNVNAAYLHNPYIDNAYKRAVTLFKSLHADDDDIFVIADAVGFGGGRRYKSKLHIFSRYIREKAVLKKLQHIAVSYTCSDDDKTHRFFLRCKAGDVRYIPMLRAICNQDMGIKPSISQDIYFINIKKRTIFHLYDDRGCDILAAAAETIRDMYETYNSWILDYDREKINCLFEPLRSRELGTSIKG